MIFLKVIHTFYFNISQAPNLNPWDILLVGKNVIEKRYI